MVRTKVEVNSTLVLPTALSLKGLAAHTEILLLLLLLLLA